jgi:hypothetical protein
MVEQKVGSAEEIKENLPQMKAGMGRVWVWA